MSYDKIIIGAGIYGLYAAVHCGKKGEQILVFEYEDTPFKRATYINQARVHMGYHYPRSLSTAVKSAGYFERFVKDYSFCIHEEFEQIYATSSTFSWTDASQFVKFCRDAKISCEEINPKAYFKDGLCDGAFKTREYTYDAMLLKDYFMEELKQLSNVKIQFNSHIEAIQKTGSEYCVLESGKEYRTPYLLNTTYASSNEIINMLGYEKFKIKYELCEIILCNVDKRLEGTGLTVMDGPFFSIMPFGKTGYHSLTSVTFTPHTTSYDPLPQFPCQNRSKGHCKPENLGNCNDCPAKPESAFLYMSNLARKYMKDEYGFSYVSSLYSMKPILMNSEIDDSRPTVIRKFTENPTFVSVLSGKINTVYDLDEVL